MKSFTSAASEYLEVSSEIDRRYSGDEAIRHRVRTHLPSMQIESCIKDKTQRHFGAFHSVSFGFPCLPMCILRQSLPL